MNYRRRFLKLFAALPFVASLPEEEFTRTVQVERSISEIEAEVIVEYTRIETDDDSLRTMDITDPEFIRALSSYAKKLAEQIDQRIIEHYLSK